MAALMLGTMIVAPSLRSAAGQRLASKEADVRPPSVDPFVYVGLIDSQTGGLPGRVESIYAGRTNKVQLSSESTDGTLHRFAEGRADTTRIFEALREVAPAQDAPSTGKAELPDFFPPRVALAFSTVEGAYRIETHPRDDVPARLAPIVEAVVALRGLSTLTSVAPGLYARAQRIPGFDPRIQPLDLVLDRAAARADARLSRALQEEMSLVRVGSLGERVRLGERVTLEPGRPLHVRVGEIVFRIIAYRFEGS